MPLALKMFLNDLMQIMKQDYPQQLRQLIEDANGVKCLQTLDKERAVIKVCDEDVIITSKAPLKEINVRVVLTRNCLFKLLDGELTLEEAFQTNEFEVFGEPEILLKCYRIWERVLSLSRTSPRFYFLTAQLR